MKTKIILSFLLTALTSSYTFAQIPANPSNGNIRKVVAADLDPNINAKNSSSWSDLKYDSTPSSITVPNTINGDVIWTPTGHGERKYTSEITYTVPSQYAGQTIQFQHFGGDTVSIPSQYAGNTFTAPSASLETRSGTMVTIGGQTYVVPSSYTIPSSYTVPYTINPSPELS